MSEEFSVSLPFPPSVNRIWRHARGRKRGRVQNYLSEQGQAFYDTCVPMLQDMRCGMRPISGRVAVNITLFPPTRAKRDIDNNIKAILDALTRGHVWDDDSQVDVLVVVRGSVIRGGRADVSVKQI